MDFTMARHRRLIDNLERYTQMKLHFCTTLESF